MTDVPLAWPPPGGPPVSTMPPRPGRARPWWGLGDVWLGVPFIIILALFGLLLGIPFAGISRLEELLSGDDTGVPAAILASSLLAQQFGQGVWPLLVAKWKGLGPIADWRLRFKPVDLLLGAGTALIAVGGAAVVSALAAGLVNLEDGAEADNTQFLRDAEGTPWLYVFLFSVVIGAPLAEELFFRGLVLRAFEKRGGRVLAVVGSTLLFTLPHWSGSGVAGTVVLFSAIGVVGAVLATVTVQVGRLWPAVFAHMLFNTLGAAQALGAFDGTTG